MNAARRKSELLALRARIDSLIEEEDRDPDAREPSPWMTADEYAAHAHVSTKTVRRWLEAGMPHAKAPVRIHRDQGDAWRTKLLDRRGIKPEPHDDLGWIYFVRAEGTSMVKIGFSRNVEHRVGELETSSAVPLAIIGVRRGRLADERDLHERFAHLRAHREWFREEGELAKLLESFAEAAE